MTLRVSWQFCLCILVVLLSACNPAVVTAPAVGVKFARPGWEYTMDEKGQKLGEGQTVGFAGSVCGENRVCDDFVRLRNDRITHAMIALPWSTLQPGPDTINRVLLQSIDNILAVADPHHQVSIMFAIHNTAWCSGSFEYPSWVKTASYGWNGARVKCDATGGPDSVLFDTTMQTTYVNFVSSFIATIEKEYPQIFSRLEGYDVMGEMVAGGRYADAERWEGVSVLLKRIKATYAGNKKVFYGNVGANPGYDRYIWLGDTGKVAANIQSVWVASDYISAQLVEDIKHADTNDVHLPKHRLRTEEVMTNAFYGAVVSKGVGTPDQWDWNNVDLSWADNDGSAPRYYDYVGAYEFEGQKNQGVNRYDAFYAWSVGAFSYNIANGGGGKKNTLVDHREGPLNGKPLPYYYALRDLSSGVDSFENYDLSLTIGSGDNLVASLEENMKQLAFFYPMLPVNNGGAPAAVSPRWHMKNGASITAFKNANSAPDAEHSPVPDSTSFVGISLPPGKESEVYRSTISYYWKRNGVTNDDSFMFALKLLQGEKNSQDVKLFARLAGGSDMCSSVIDVKSDAGRWEKMIIPFGHCLESVLSASPPVSEIEVGFRNVGDSSVTFLIDDFILGNPSVHDWDRDGIADNDDLSPFDSVIPQPFSDDDGDGIVNMFDGYVGVGLDTDGDGVADAATN